jgi:pilus assembly protein CpaE
VQVLVLTDSKETADLISSLLADESSVLLRTARMAFDEGQMAVVRFEPHLVVIADTIDSPAAAVEDLDTASPNVPIVVILDEGDVAGAQQCTLAGARATLFKPFDRSMLLTAVHQVVAKEMRRRQLLATTMEAGPVRAQRPRIIAVHGVKGGVGATTIACNLAAALRRLTSRRVLLFDADLLSNDAGVLCDLMSPRTLSDLLPVIRELDADLLDSVVVSHPSGIRVLLGPEHLQRAELIRGEDMERTLTAIKPYHDYTVVDTASGLTPVTLAALDEADLIVLVVTPELIALRDAAKFVQLSLQLGYPPEKLFVVANRANAGREIDVSVIEKQLQRPVAAAIPSDGKTLIECMNLGELVVVSRPRNKVSTSVEALARTVATRLGWNPEAARAGAAQPAGVPTTSPSDAPHVNGHMSSTSPDGAAATGTAPASRGSALRRFGRVLPRFGKPSAAAPKD